MINSKGNINIDIKEKKYRKEQLENTEISPSKKQRSDDKNNNTNKMNDQSHCAKCNKKLKLTDIKCKCNKYFCAKHRYSDTHDCTFDYKNHAKQLLEKQNPLVIFQKMEKL